MRAMSLCMYPMWCSGGRNWLRYTMDDWSSLVRRDSRFFRSLFLTRFKQMMGDPYRLKQATKWRPAGLANGVALSTAVNNGTRVHSISTRSTQHITGISCNYMPNFNPLLFQHLSGHTAYQWLVYDKFKMNCSVRE